MNTKQKPCIVRAKIVRTVTEIAKVKLDRQGNIEEFLETIEEIDFEDVTVMDIRSIISVHS